MGSVVVVHPVRRTVIGVLWLLPSVLYLLVVLFSPIDTISSSESLNKFVLTTKSMLASSFPSIDLFRHARSTQFSEVAQLATAYAVYLIGSTAAAFFLYFFPAFFDKKLRVVPPRSGILGMIFIVPFVLFVCIWGFYCTPGDWSFFPGLTTEYRVGYLMISFVVIQMVGILAGYWPILVFDGVSRIFSKGDNNV
ncbi:hypothetical protein PV762_07240 [Mitsuaria sp. CC2]|uniref:hypothetical protein n=1 Tax=Mitsuaria sp. CC2 TaxID=3029186 RepID=UPI003B8D7E45